jgi:hypothetical protein
MLGLTLAGPLVAAASANNLESIGVTRMGDSIVVTIETSTDCEYNAFLTDSRPERIVVDLMGVVNNLEEKQFSGLPLKSVKSIRTSQFKTEPELQARVVLDIERPINFRSYRDGDKVVVILPVIADEAQIAAWSYPAADAVYKPAIEPEEEEAVKSDPVETDYVEQPAADPDEAEIEEVIPPAQLTINAPAVAPGMQVDTTPKRKTVEYSSVGQKDPFESLIGTGSGKSSEGLPSLENLKLVGILEDSDINRALLEDAEGNGYMLKANDKIQSGFLVTVTNNKAIFQITEYGWTRTVALELAIPEIK